MHKHLRDNRSSSLETRMDDEVERDRSYRMCVGLSKRIELPFLHK